MDKIFVKKKAPQARFLVKGLRRRHISFIKDKFYERKL